jgi:hypothetical protein
MVTSEITKRSAYGAPNTGADYMHWVWGHEGQQVPKRIITWHVTSRADVRPDKQVSHTLTHSNSLSLSLFPFDTPEDGCSHRVAYTFRNAKEAVNTMTKWSFG